jgi:hypothetical protein
MKLVSTRLHGGTTLKEMFMYSAERQCRKNNLFFFFWRSFIRTDRFCGLLGRVLGYRSRGPGSIPGTTRKKSKGSGTGSTQPREYN